MDGRLRNEEVARRIGHNVFRARRRAGYSQEELGKRCSPHRTEIGMIESGDRLPRSDTLTLPQRNYWSPHCSLESG